jgi:hypothetical protein
LDRIRGHARACAKLGESGVYDGSGACDLPRARGSRIPCSGGGICRGVRGVLCVGVWCAIKLVSLLVAAVLRPEIASLDPLGDLAHGGLCNPVRGLYED